MKIFDTDFQELGKKVLRKIEILSNNTKGWSVVPNNYEGIRIQCDKNNGNGWFLLRMSLHDPVMPLNIESETKGGVNFIRNKLTDFFKKQEGIDINTL